MALNLQGVGIKWIFLSSICGLFQIADVMAQFSFVPAEIPVSRGNSVLRMPWAGGLNSIQYNSLNLNSDDNDDLVLFDRTSNKLSTYLWENNTFRYAPEYEIFFPDDLVSWVLLRDYDCDGNPDLFTDSQQGMRVFRNSGTDPVSWELISDPVRTLGSQVINLFFNASDIISIDDVDNDGDLDVLAFNFATGENIDFHQNMSIERTGFCGLDFVRITRNYGQISECDCGDFSFVDPCPVNGRTLHSGGKALLTIDLDNDGDKELFIGEETCNELAVLTNIGTPSEAFFNDFLDFFQNPNDILFPTAYNIDLNSDGLKDLAISTNLRENIDNQIDFSNSSYFYENTGSNELPEFELNTTNFLQSEMIDVGELAHPAFADYDRDGDQDLFIGNRGITIDNNFRGTLYLYENTGSASEPEFTLITDDYLLLSSLHLIDIKPQFIDLNSDNRLDLVFTANSAQTGNPEMNYILNGSSTEFQFDLSGINLLSDISALSGNPTLGDINRDGIVDILIGRSIGTLEFYQNFNTNTSPDFQLQENNFLGITPSIERINLVPHIFDVSKDGIPDLITTDGSGELSIYENFAVEEIPVERVILKNSLTEELTPTNLGRISWPAATDLYNTGSIDLAVGTISGGVFLMQDTTSLSSLGNESLTLDVFPNPSIGNVVFIRSNIPGTMSIFDISGKLIIPDTFLEANQPFLLESSLYYEGVYIIRLVSRAGKTASRRLILSN